MTVVVSATELRKSYGASEALRGLDWTVPAGSITALLGPNGAGKTTFAKIALGISRPTSGQMQILGLDPVRDAIGVRKRTAFVPEDKTGFDTFTVREFFRYYRGFFTTWNDAIVDDLTRRLQLTPTRRIAVLSKGGRSAVFAAAALAREPDLLVLDEPTDGLDPAAREILLQKLLEVPATGSRTVVLVTHNLSEAERIADRVAILDRGRIVTDGDLDDLRAAWKTVRARLSGSASPLPPWPDVHRIERANDHVTIVTSRCDAVLAHLAAAGATGIAVSDMSLREIYLSVVSAAGEVA